MEHSTGELEARRAGREVEPLEGSDDEINARFQAAHKHMSHDDAHEWAQREFDRRVEAVEAIPQERWNPMLEAVARADGAQHYRAHHNYIAIS
jgi:hypothetical protein